VRGFLLEKTMIRAELTGSDCATACDVTARTVTGLCRKMVAAGYDPETPIEAYRNGTMAIRCRTIGDAAKYEVVNNACGTPVFRAMQVRILARWLSQSGEAAWGEAAE
jgi:hypothetical protein